MKLNQRQRELAESALQTPEWREDRKASWGLLLAGILFVAIFSGPTTALICLGMGLAVIIIFSLEPFTGMILMLVAITVGAFSLHNTEVVFALGYLLLVLGVGFFWLLRNIRFEDSRASSLEESDTEPEDE